MASFQDGGKLGIEIKMQKDSRYQKLVFEYWNKMKSGFWSREYLDSIFQKFERFQCDIYDAAFFADIHTGIQSGQILTALIDLEEEPSADKMIEENKTKLASLPSPFHSTIWCGTADCDGELGWRSSIKCGQIVGDIEKSELIQPRTVPLEIGDTEAWTTLAHLGREGGLARWPYGSKKIYLFVTVDKKYLFGNRIEKALEDAGRNKNGD